MSGKLQGEVALERSPDVTAAFKELAAALNPKPAAEPGALRVRVA